MKILKVEFENINSLKGEWTIDFTDPSYGENHDLFVVCGDTGTGKTSILDAITLAIYGCTPRQGLVCNNANGNEVMTRDTGNCFARVTYKCVNGTFVTEWRQRRAHDRPDGNLQNSEGLVYRLENPDTPLFNGRTGSGKELAKVNEKNIQLDYSQFCRSIMLAQGEFNKFLSCNEKERAEILEKLNGSEKYRKIAVKAGDHWSSAKDAFGKAESAYNAVAQDVLTPEQLLEMIAEQKRLQSELDGLKKSLDGINLLLNWYRNLENQKSALDFASQNLEQVLKAKADFVEDAALLERGLRAKNCEVAFLRVLDLEKSKAQKEADLADLQNSLNSLRGELENASKNADNCGHVLAAAETAVRNGEDLWNEVRKLDSDLKNARLNVAAITESVDKFKNEFLTFESAEKRNSDSVENLKSRIAKGEIYLKENASDEKIAGVLSGFNAQIGNYRIQETRLASVTSDARASEEKIAEFEKEKSGLQSKFENLQSYLKLHEIDGTLPQVMAESRGLVGQLENAVSEMKSQEAAVQKCKAEGLKLAERLDRASQEIAFVEREQLQLFNNDVIVLADVIQKHLVKGEACPVCGSREHPSCDGAQVKKSDFEKEEAQASDVASKIRALNEKLQNARSDKNAVEGESRLNENALEAAENALRKAAVLYDEMSKKLASAWAPWEKSVSAETCRAVLEELQKLSETFAAKNNEKESLAAKLRDVETCLNEQKASLNSCRAQTAQLQGDLKNLAKEMECSISVWISNFRTEDLESIYKTLENRSVKFAGAQKLYDDLQLELGTAETELRNSGENKTAAKLRLDESQKNLDQANECLNKLVSVRLEKFGEQNVDFVEKSARDSVEKARGESEATLAKLHDLQKSEGEVRSKIDQRRNDIETDSFDLKTSRAEFLKELSRNHFVSAEEFKLARLQDEKIQELQKREIEIGNNCVAATQSKSDAENSYKKCLAEHVDAEPKETLLQRQAEQQALQKEIEEAHIKVSVKLGANASKVENLSALQRDVEKTRVEYNRWDVMREWLGVKDGSKFSTFVQGLTFKSLLKLANRQLHEMKDRYTLIPKGDLEFEILDTHFESPRSISNLSGGEKFLVSLSLALGIAEFASRNVKIESLFMDEGFGTLDGDMLESVMESLRAQRSKGKMLGVITHVQSVIESIDQKIELKAGRDGHSTISGPGVFHGIR